MLIVDENLYIETLLLVGVGFTKEALCTLGISTLLGSRKLMDAGSHCGSTAGVRCRLGDPGLFV